MAVHVAEERLLSPVRHPHGPLRREREETAVHLDRDVLALIGDKRCITIINKSDIAIENCQNGIRVSAKMGKGLDVLEAAIYDKVLGDKTQRSDIVVTSERQVEKLRDAKFSLQKALESIRIGAEMDMVSIEVQAAIESLGEILGTSVGDSVISKIFSDFCVGK